MEYSIYTSNEALTKNSQYNNNHEINEFMRSRDATSFIAKFY